MKDQRQIVMYRTTNRKSETSCQRSAQVAIVCNYISWLYILYYLLATNNDVTEIIF